MNPIVSLLTVAGLTKSTTLVVVLYVSEPVKLIEPTIGAAAAEAATAPSATPANKIDLRAPITHTSAVKKTCPARGAAGGGA